LNFNREFDGGLFKCGAKIERVLFYSNFLPGIIKKIV